MSVFVAKESLIIHGSSMKRSKKKHSLYSRMASYPRFKWKKQVQNGYHQHDRIERALSNLLSRLGTEVPVSMAKKEKLWSLSRYRIECATLNNTRSVQSHSGR